MICLRTYGGCAVGCCRTFSGKPTLESNTSVSIEGGAAMSAGRDAWTYTFWAGYLVPPCRGLSLEDASRIIRGSPISVNDIPNGFFAPLFCDADVRCPIGVAFLSDEGRPSNSVRDLVRLIALGDLESRESAARELAGRLACATSERSPEGLFVIMAGTRIDGEHRVLMWKFPADETLQATMSATRMTISLLDDAFSKSTSYFKAAMFEGRGAQSHFWRGRVEDRQAKQRVPEVAKFWVMDFLECRPEMTDAHGTRLVAKALAKELSTAESLGAIEALMGAALVLRSLGGQPMSVGEFARRYLPEALQDSFVKTAGGPGIADQLFAVDLQIVDELLRFKSVVLDGAFIVKGPASLFDDRVSIQSTDHPEEVELSMRGVITAKRLERR